MKEYSPREISITACGILLPTDGFDPDDAIKIEAADPEVYKAFIGLMGDHTRVRNFNDLVTVTFMMYHKAPATALLSALHTLDKSSPNGLGIAPTSIRNRSGVGLWLMPESYIVGPPATVSFNKELGKNEWKIAGLTTVRVDE